MIAGHTGWQLNMETRGLMDDGSNLFDFYAAAVSTCFSPGADGRCVPVGLCALSALLLLFSFFVLVRQRSKHRTDPAGESLLFLYRFLGDMCGAVGAVLSRQLHIQIFMGASAAAVDAVQFVSCCFPVFLCWNSESERRWRMMRRRRRQHLLAACILMVVAGGLLKSRVTHCDHTTAADGRLQRRRLLHVALQDNTEILGYILGLVSFVIGCTSRFPALGRAIRGHSLSVAHVISGLLCSLAAGLYAAAILLYDTHIQFLLRVLPWLLSAISCVTLDLLILVLHWGRRGARQQPRRLSPDTEVLLVDCMIPAAGKKHRKQQVAPAAHTKSETDTGPYMDVSIHPPRTICLKEVKLSKQAVERLPDRTERVVRVDRYCSSDNSCYSSPVSSDLEWDFEHEAHDQWKELTQHQFLLHEWPETVHSHKTCVTSGLPQKARPGTDDSGSVAAPTLAK